MTLTYRDLRDILIPRAARLGLVDAESEQVDAVELEMYLYNALFTLIELADLSAYTVRKPSLCVTEPLVVAYALPEDFGRLVHPTPLMTRGLRIEDGVARHPLFYCDPGDFDAKDSQVPGRPTHFTVQRRQLLLFPVPDQAYVVRGLYIERVPRPELDDEVVLEYPTALIEETLFKLASDNGSITQSLATTRTEALARLTGGDMGSATQIGERFTSLQRA